MLSVLECHRNEACGSFFTKKQLNIRNSQVVNIVGQRKELIWVKKTDSWVAHTSIASPMISLGVQVERYLTIDTCQIGRALTRETESYEWMSCLGLMRLKKPEWPPGSQNMDSRNICIHYMYSFFYFKSGTICTSRCIGCMFSEDDRRQPWLWCNMDLIFCYEYFSPGALRPPHG